ncbi:ARPP-2 domain-containing protein [Streptomyces thermoalcalitolerans]|uniref:ARG and Rhodanese-Phosphatase-superfamily-associated domain-containing protein n=1 Tax=Streptomyces thermoalcalitolerans TaxID=65605 RepID=A0ABN1NNC6_9ACTN
MTSHHSNDLPSALPSGLLDGLETRPSQVWGAVRLVPLVRTEAVQDLRLHPRILGGPGVVDLGRGESYWSYIPHGFVAEWTGDGSPAAAYGTQLTDGAQDQAVAAAPLHVQRRMVRREATHRLRFLPLHLALEGYLSLHFGGPSVAWEQWSQQALRRGLSPRVEAAYLGADVPGLADALRVFEIHPGQCGVLVHLADTPATAFVVPHPEDYRVLHPTLLQDLYGDLVHHYATLMPPVPDFRSRIDDTRIRSLADLRKAAREQVARWADFHDTTMVSGLLEQERTWQQVQRMGRFTLFRFLPPFRLRQDNHIGEVITDEHGRTVYLKTFRLSENQVRRGHLLSRLAAHDWHLADTAAALGLTESQLGLRLEAAGFGHLLRQDVLDRYRSQTRTGHH